MQLQNDQIWHARARLCAGSLDREKLGKVVFEDARLRRRLNAATHLPIVVQLVLRVAWLWLLCRKLVVWLPCLWRGAMHLRHV